MIALKDILKVNFKLKSFFSESQIRDCYDTFDYVPYIIQMIKALYKICVQKTQTKSSDKIKRFKAKSHTQDILTFMQSVRV